MYARRAVLKGIAGLPIAAALAGPEVVRAATENLETVSITTPGGEHVSAALALPEVTPAPAIMLVHEWWGLNDRIKSVAAQLAKEGYVALAIDLYGGKVADNPDDARAYMELVQEAIGITTVASWIDWLRARDDTTAKVGTVGWSFGGGWSLNASIARPVEATVVYYGRVDKNRYQLAALRGPVLGHFATRDTWIDKAMVDGFEKAMDTAGKIHTTYWYDADHGFANPTGASYDAEAAALAWKRTLAFFKANLKPAGS